MERWRIYYTENKEKRAGMDLAQNNADELNTGSIVIPVFTGDSSRQANADTLDDFVFDRLRWKTLSYTQESEDVMRALYESDVKISAMEENSGREWEQAFFAHMDNYIMVLMLLISDILNIKDASRQGCFLRQLDAMLRWKCCLVSREDRLMIPQSHPMEVAVRTFDRWISDGQRGTGLLTYEILESQRKRRSRYMVYSTDQVYLRNNNRDTVRGAEEGIPFYETEKLTDISSIRLIEKVEHYIKTRKIEPQSCVRVACLGEIQKPEKLIEYYQSIPDSNLAYQVQLIQLKRDKDSSGLVFSVTGSYPEDASRDSDRRMFNLMKLSDLEVLFKQYNIVLFMDEGCFYCQGQEGKSIEERMVQAQLEWVLQTAKKEPKKENRILYYMQAYRTVGEWLNSFNSGATARMQFNEKLFKTIQSVMTPQYEVYLYASYGKRIPFQNLYNRDVCNDENYDGKELAVYKVPSQSRDLSGDVARFLKFSKDKKVKVDLWKIIKSISNDFYIKFFTDINKANGNADIDEHQWVRLFRNIRLIVSWQEPFTGDSKLEFRIEKVGDESYYKQIGNFVQEVLIKGFLDVKHTCVQKYLHRLLGNAISSRAMDIEGILVGYLLKDGFFDSRVAWEGFVERTNSDENNDMVLSSQFFEPRRTILSVISNLNATRIRDYERKEEYLLYEFRNRYCPNISEAVFSQLVKAIHKACENMGYVNNRLYYHSES